jgi:hypothetical protein
MPLVVFLMRSWSTGPRRMLRDCFQKSLKKQAKPFQNWNFTAASAMLAGQMGMPVWE